MMTFEQRIEKFLRTVQENPGLPVYCWVDNVVVCDDTADRWLGEIADCRVADVAVYNGEWYGDQDELIEAYYAQHDEEYEGWHGVTALASGVMKRDRVRTPRPAG